MTADYFDTLEAGDPAVIAYWRGQYTRPQESRGGAILTPARHDRAEGDLLEFGEDAAWALFAENEQHDLDVWLHFRAIPRGDRMAALYGFGEVRP